jgi:D-glycero-alpha-D-manno-heptose-7-phosphate kinase
MNKIVVSRAPFRISLAGGGTDIISYCSKFGGQVIGFSIDRYVVTTLLPRNFQGVNDFLSHDNESFSEYSQIKNQYLLHALKALNFNRNFKASILSDAPPNTGLGGSAAFLNSFIYAAGEVVDSNFSMVELAELSSSVEIEDLNRPVGKQDHYLSSLGGMNLLTFDEKLNVSHTKINVKDKCIHYFNSRLLLFYTNITRSAGKVLSDQSNKMEKSNQDTINLMHDIKSLVSPMYDAIINDNPDEIGPILAEHWYRKRSLTNSSADDQISELIDLAYKNGAYGCKILVAGGGGFILFCSKEGMLQKIRAAFTKNNIKELKFNIEFEGISANTITI